MHSDLGFELNIPPWLNLELPRSKVSSDDHLTNVRIQDHDDTLLPGPHGVWHNRFPSNLLGSHDD